MRKLKYSVLLFTLLFCTGFPKINGYAAPKRDESTEEATEQEENTEEASEEAEAEEPDDGKEWFLDEKTGFWYYRDKAKTNTTGWCKIDGYWYYFNAKGEMQANKYIGLHHLDSDGKLVDEEYSDDYTPEPHGEIVNASSYILLTNGNDNITKVNESISSLYDRYKDGKDISENDIRQVRYSYNSLTYAEKVQVTNESKLAEVENAHFISYDYDELYATQTDAATVDEGTKKSTTYTFQISESEDKTTIITRFTTDTDMDGVGDVPEISLLAPTGETYTIDEQDTEIRVPDINMSLTWTDNFLQMDVSNAENGNWTITTSLVCTFQQREYSGAQRDYNPIPDSELASKNDAEEDEEENDKTTSPLKALLPLFLVTIFGIVLFTVIKKINFGGKKADEDQNDYRQSSNIAAPASSLSKEEELEKLKQELQAIEQEMDYSDDYFESSITKEPAQNVESAPKYSEEEINESVEEYDSFYYDSSYDEINSSDENGIGNNQMPDNTNYNPESETNEWEEDNE